MTASQMGETERDLREQDSETFSHVARTLLIDPDVKNAQRATTLDADEWDPESPDYVPRGARWREKQLGHRRDDDD